MKKKSQVTIFIIIALVIIIIFSLLFLLKGKLSPTVKQKYIEAPASVKPIQDFVEHSIQQSLIEATVSLGEHCGLVDPNNFKVSGNLDDPTESIVLKPFYLSNRICPYWYFMNSPNTCESQCKFNSLMPNLKSNFPNQMNYSDYSLEAQIDRHIKADLKKLNFRDFNFQDFKIKQDGNINVTTTIGSDIKVNVNYPLKITKDGKEYNLNHFLVKLPFDLNKVYRIAAKITAEEKNKRFLENFATSLISIYSGVDKNKLPPYTRQVDFMNSPVFWQITDVKNQLRKKVLTKIPAITVYGSKNFNNQTPVSGAVLNFPGEDLSNVEVYFTFPDSKPFYLALNRMKDGAIGPSTSITNLLFYQFRVNDYWIAYDLSFPVLVTLKVPSKISDESYQFQFALEANIRNSRPLWENTTTLNNNQGSTMFCDNLQRISGETKISTRDYSGRSIGNIDIYYKCGDSGCYIGTTDNNGLLKTKLPVCVNGVLVANKNDYIGKYKQYTSLKDKKASVRLEVGKLKEFGVDVRKLVFTKEETPLGFRWGYKALSNYEPSVDSLKSDEQLIVTFKRIDSNADDFEMPVEIKGSSFKLPKVKLLPGKYEVNAQLIKNKKIVIPGSNGFLGAGKTNDTEINTSQCGGIILNQKTGYFDLTKDKFENSNSITLYTIYFDLYNLNKDDLKAADLAVNNDIEMLSQKYRKNLEPILR